MSLPPAIAINSDTLWMPEISGSSHSSKNTRGRTGGTLVLQAAPHKAASAWPVLLRQPSRRHAIILNFAHTSLIEACTKCTTDEGGDDVRRKSEKLEQVRLQAAIFSTSAEVNADTRLLPAYCGGRTVAQKLRRCGPARREGRASPSLRLDRQFAPAET
jgi:hypothetical protein